MGRWGVSGGMSRAAVASACARLRAGAARVPPFALLCGAVVALMVVMAAGVRERAAIQHALGGDPARIHLVAGPHDHEQGVFAPCRGGHRFTCVIDGDTIWYRGTKIRVADINAPEISEPACDAELDLGDKATVRMTELLNEGPFSLVPLRGRDGRPDGRDADVYGRKLRTIMRGGQSLGGVLVAEGLAERWVGFRRDWCD